MEHNVKLFVTRGCPFCQRAMAWMEQYKVEHELTVFETTTAKMEFYAQHEGVSTVPQIFVDGVRIGGWTDLAKSDFKREIEEAAGK